MHGKETVSFNKEAVKKMSKADFVKMHEHHKDDVDLDATYDEIVGKEKPIKSDKHTKAEKEE